MITIIAGGLNQGKTQTMLKLYEQNHKGDGFACKKVFKNNQFIGFNFVRLSNQEEIPFMIRNEFYTNQKEYDEAFKAYHFSNNALQKVLTTITDLLNKGVEPIYLDEVGILETKGLGHNEAFLKIINSKKEAFICVRDTFVDKVTNYYHLQDFRIVGVKKMNSINLINAQVYVDHHWQKTNIGIKGSKIKEIGQFLSPSEKVIDLKGHKIIPGLIDPHVHFDLDLGFIRSKDDFNYGSKAAIYGGITTIVDFLAPARNAQELKEFYDLRCEEAKKCHVNYHFHACIRNPNGDLEEFVKMMKSLGMNTLKLFTTYSDSDRRTYDNQIIELLKLSKKYDFLVIVHAENDELIKTSDTAKNIEIAEYRNSQCEITEVLKLAGYARETKGNLYIVHTSSGETVKQVKAQFADILHKNFWLESCPQYFLFNKERLNEEDGNLFTFAPPLRSSEEQDLLIENIKTISTIGTDHCAFMKKDKNDYPLLSKHPFGIGGIENSFLVLHQMFGDQIIDKMSKNIAKLDKLGNIGEIKVGNLANLTIFKTCKPWALGQGHGKVDYSVYQGLIVKEKITHTMINGKFHLLDGEYISLKGKKF